MRVGLDVEKAVHLFHQGANYIHTIYSDVTSRMMNLKDYITMFSEYGHRVRTR